MSLYPRIATEVEMELTDGLLVAAGEGQGQPGTPSKGQGSQKEIEAGGQMIKNGGQITQDGGQITKDGGQITKDGGQITKDGGPEGGEHLPEREGWDSKLEFLLSCLSFAVGLGNIWRFPYLCYKNGGGAFLIPYVINLAFTGLPLFFFELSLGQFAQSSPIALWSILPIFQGIGYSMLLIVIGIGLYYNVIIAWILYYLIDVILSIPSGRLPWAGCDNSWNTASCADRNTSISANMSVTSPTEEYFEHKMLQTSSGIDDVGGLRLEVAGCLLLAWAIVFLALIKGVKSLGKAVYFTATFPYIMLTILLGYALFLDGAIDGIKYYLYPDLRKLLEGRVWAEAAMQIFFSLGPCWGSLITLASYNKFNNNTLRDAVFIACGNCLTSFYAGFVVFAFLGFMAHSTNQPIEAVVGGGPGLAFIIYPEAVTLLPCPHFWAVMFFLMMLTLGLGTQFSIMETITRIVVDALPGRVSHRKVLICSCSLMFLIGLSMTTNGGVFVLQMMDRHAGTYCALLTGLVELLAVSWLYGADRFLEDIRRMIGWTGREPFYRVHKIYWVTLWQFVTPLLLLVFLCSELVSYMPMEYQGYIYPRWANLLGWGVSSASVLCIPAVFVWKGRTARWRCVELVRPQPQWGQAERDFRQQAGD